MKSTMKKLGLLLAVMIMAILFTVSASAVDCCNCDGNGWITWDDGNLYVCHGVCEYYRDSCDGTDHHTPLTEMSYNRDYPYGSSYGINVYSDYLVSVNINTEVRFVHFGGEKLTNITLSGSAESVSFDNCDSLGSIPSLPANVEYISIADCDSLSSISLPAGIKDVQINNCENLKHLSLPEGIETAKITNCPSIENITLPSSLKDFDLACPGLESVTISDGIKKIPHGAFMGCRSLKTITLPKSVTEIGQSAFSGCSSLTSVKILGCLTESMGDYEFDDCENLNEIIFSTCSSGFRIGSYAFQNCSSIKKIVLPEGLTKISSYFAEWISNLEEIVIPSTVTEIGERAFSGCSELKKINLPDGLTTIGKEAFNTCNFEELELTDNLTAVHDQAFVKCSVKNLIIDRKECNFTLPSAENIIVTEKAENLDNLCSFNTASQPNLKNVSVDEDNQYFSSEEGVLFNKDKINLILYPTAKEDIIYNMPNSVERICSYAFYNNKNLEYVKLPDSLKYIEEYSFFYCSNLGSISIIPNGVEEIELLAFGNHAITDVYFNGTEAEWKSVEVINSSLNVGAFYPTVTMHFKEEIVDPVPPEEPEEPDVPNVPITPIEPEDPKPEDHEHFYDDDEDETCNTCGYDRTENCDCRCHNDNFFAKIIWSITNFFNKIFKKNKICDCGIAHY